MDIYDRYRDNPAGCRPTLIAALVLAFIFVVLCATGCRSVKTTTTEQIRWHDSTIYHHVTDTTHVTVTDTVHVEVHSSKTTENGTQIQFGQGGGTYNSKTGEATNVVGVTESSKINEQQDMIANLQSKLDMYRVRCDSLTEQVSDYERQYEQKTEKSGRSGWDRFCTWWFIITAILLLLKIACWVMEKIPATAHWVAIVRKFVPVL